MASSAPRCTATVSSVGGACSLPSIAARAPRCKRRSPRRRIRRAHRRRPLPAGGCACRARRALGGPRGGRRRLVDGARKGMMRRCSRVPTSTPRWRSWRRRRRRWRCAQVREVSTQLGLSCRCSTTKRSRWLSSAPPPSTWGRARVCADRRRRRRPRRQADRGARRAARRHRSVDRRPRARARRRRRARPRHYEQPAAAHPRRRSSAFSRRRRPRSTMDPRISARCWARPMRCNCASLRLRRCARRSASPPNASYRNS